MNAEAIEYEIYDVKVGGVSVNTNGYATRAAAATAARRETTARRDAVAKIWGENASDPATLVAVYRDGKKVA